MHFEFLVEDQSGKKALDTLVPMLLGDGNTHRIISYNGLGHIPKALKPKSDANKRILLDQLPRLLPGYGSVPYIDCVVVVCDLDDRNKQSFLEELHGLLDSCNPKPKACFCLAIEELEAWYLGDLAAVRKAYPTAKNNVLDSYVNDSICGTWELLANAVYDGGSEALSKKGWQCVGKQKFLWAEAICPYMDVGNNASLSFNHFRLELHRRLQQ